MYRIIGSDHKEYGPLSAEQVRQCLAEGRAHAHSSVQTEGSSEWKSLSDFPEFAEQLMSRTSKSSLAKTAPRGKLSGLAIASLLLGVLGIVTCGATIALARRGLGAIFQGLSLFGALALLGVVMGTISLVRIRRSQGALRGMGYGLAGAVVSALVLALALGLSALIAAQLKQAKAGAPAFWCMNNLRQLAAGTRSYLEDHQNRFPPAAGWGDALQEYIGNPKTFQCPLGNPTNRCHFGFNAQLSGIDRQKVTAPGQTVLFFEIEGGWNVSGGSEFVLSQPRHPWPTAKQGAIALAFADGHTEMANESRLQALRWQP